MSAEPRHVTGSPPEVDITAKPAKPAGKRLRRVHDPSRKVRCRASSKRYRDKQEEANAPDRDEIAAALIKHIIDHIGRGSENAIAEAQRALQRLPEKYNREVAFSCLMKMVAREKARQRREALTT